MTTGLVPLKRSNRAALSSVSFVSLLVGAAFTAGHTATQPVPAPSDRVAAVAAAPAH